MNIDEEQYIEKYLKDSLRTIIANSVDEEIDKKVHFERTGVRLMNPIQENIFYEADKEYNPDHAATPRYVVEDIYDLIDIRSFKMIWFPFDNYDSHFKLKADELNLKYKATHIFDDCGNDFFQTLPPKNCDLLISNPPFSQQNEIIKRTFELIDGGLIKSFCLLLPLSTLETPTRAEMYEKYIDKIYIYTEENQDYLDTEDEFYLLGYTFGNLSTRNFINDKVEILEEDKDIEELKIENDNPTYFYIRDEKGTKCGMTKHSKMIAEKLNEVIREVNKLRSKEQ